MPCSLSLKPSGSLAGLHYDTGWCVMIVSVVLCCLAEQQSVGGGVVGMCLLAKGCSQWKERSCY